MINRRRLLANLLKLAGLAVLLSACKHGSPSESKKTPERDGNGKDDGGY
jgi:hypothetical protein